MENTVPWLTIRQAAERAQLCEATIRREVKAGRLNAVRVGGRRSLRLRPSYGRMAQVQSEGSIPIGWSVASPWATDVIPDALLKGSIVQQSRG